MRSSFFTTVFLREAMKRDRCNRFLQTLFYCNQFITTIKYNFTPHLKKSINALLTCMCQKIPIVYA